MKVWQTTALTVALLGAAGVGASIAPAAAGQTRVRVAGSGDVQVFGPGGGRLGVSISDVDAAEGKGAAGVRIDDVDEGSPAEKAGFREGDVVVEFDGERVRSARQFSRLVAETPGGRQVTAAVMRDGKRVSLNVTTRESSSGLTAFDGDGWRVLENLRDRGWMAPTPAPPRPPRAPRAPQPPALERFFYSGNQLGVTTNSLTDQREEYFGTKGGVLVTSVANDSVAARAGVKAGDVIVRLNGRSIDDGSDLRDEMQRLDSGAEFTIEVMRDRKAMTLKGKAEARSNRRWTTRTVL